MKSFLNVLVYLFVSLAHLFKSDFVSTKRPHASISGVLMVNTGVTVGTGVYMRLLSSKIFASVPGPFTTPKLTGPLPPSSVCGVAPALGVLLLGAAYKPAARKHNINNDITYCILERIKPPVF